MSATTVKAWRYTDAGNLYLYVPRAVPYSATTYPLDQMGAKERATEIENLRFKYPDGSWSHPVWQLSKGKVRELQLLGIYTFGDLIERGDAKAVEKIAKGDYCYQFDAMWKPLIEYLRENAPGLTDPTYVPHVNAVLPSNVLTLTPPTPEERERWENLTTKEQNKILASLTETMQDVFFDLLDDWLDRIAEEKVQAARKALEEAEAEAAKLRQR